MKRLTSLMVLMLLGCTTHGGKEDSKPVSTPLSGRVFLASPLADARVEVFDFRDGKQGERYAETRTAADGKWAVDLKHLYGDFLVQVTEVGLERPLSTLVTHLELEESRTIAVTPITHLRSEYARYLLERGAKLDDAVGQANSHVYGHFAGVDHDSVAPWAGETQRAVTSAMQAHLVAAAVEHHSRRIARAMGLSDSGLVTAQSLLWLLAEDVRADGVFDGLGKEGRQLSLAGANLSGDTLRADLAVSLVRLIESPEHNHTGLARADVESLARHLAAMQSPIFPPGTSPLILEEPEVVFAAPAEGAIVNGQVPVSCQATSKADLQNVRIWAVRDEQQFDIVTQSHLDMTAGRGILSAKLDTTRVADGPLVLHCAAKDRHDNERRTSVSITVNNHAGKVEVRGVISDQRLRGKIELSCVCSDDAEATGCYLTLPEPSRQAVTETQPGVYLWDTTREPEGPQVVECRADSPGLPSPSHRVPVFIDNKPDGEICGGVYLESPVRGAQVRAFSLAGEELGYESRPTDDNGRFCIKIRDVYEGPMKLVAGGPGAVYANGISGHDTPVGASSLVTLVGHYAPNATLDPLNIHGLTTLAASLALPCLERADANGVRACIGSAHESLSRHLSRDSFDIQSTPVRDFVTRGPLSERVDDEATVLGLVHMGLARLGAEIAIADHHHFDRLPSVVMVARLALDASNGLFDGLGVEIAKIPLTEAKRVTASTFRGDLAGAIARWLNNVELEGGATPIVANTTRLSSLNFSQPGALLQLMSQNQSSRLFPEMSSPEPIVFEQPDLSIIAPVEGAVLKGRVNAECHASAKADLKHVRMWVMRGEKQLDVIEDAKLEVTGGQGILKAAMETTRYGDGAIRLHCAAMDRFGNERRLNMGLTFNNHAGKVEVQGVTLNQRLQGTVNISCVCTGDDEATACYLASPTPSKSAVREIRPGTYTWDTTQEPEGPQVVECRADSPGLPSPSHQVPVFVDNKADGEICGGVYLESPVRGAQVRAFSVAGEEMGYDARPTDVSGGFCIKIRDFHHGPLRLVAGGTGAVYANGVDGRDSPLGTDGLVALLDSYVPNASVEGLSINGMTTLAAALASHCLASEPQRTCITDAHDGLGKHLSREGFDVRRFPVRDFVTSGPLSEKVGEAPTALGLVHMGLARLGAEIALADHYPVERLPSAVMVARLALDAANGQFDGLDASHRTIPLTESKQVTTDTFRGDLAAAIARWLNNVNGQGRRVTGTVRNNTELTALNFSQPGSLLQVLSQDQSLNLFPELPKPLPFDTTGPTLIMASAMTMAGDPLDLNLPQRGTVRLQVLAQDDSGISRVWVEVDGNIISGKIEHESGDFFIDLNTVALSLADGEHSARIHAQDGVGNGSSIDLRITVKNTAPVLALGVDKTWFKANEAVRLHLDAVGGAIKSFEISGTAGAVPKSGILAPGTSSFDVDYEVPCNREVEISVRVTDWAGNEGSAAPVRVICDNHQPKVVFSQSPFRQEKAGFNGSYDADGRFVMTHNGVPEAKVDIPSGGSEPQVLQKYAHRLDYLPAEGLDIERQNLPVLRFMVDDRPNGETAGCGKEEVRVEYRYIIDAPWGRIEGDWRPIPISDPGIGSFVLPISYQTLLAEGPVEERRKNNFIQPCSLLDTHTLEIRATDLAGNSTTEAYSFKFEIQWPPIHLDNCTFNPEVRRGLVELAPLLASPKFNLVHANLFWDFQRSANSLSPDLRIAVQVGGGQTHAAIDVIGLHMRAGPWSNPSITNFASRGGVVRWDNGKSEVYFRDPPPFPRTFFLPRDEEWAQQISLFSAEYANGQQAPTRGNGFEIDGANSYRVIMSIAPSLVFDGGMLSPHLEFEEGASRIMCRRTGGIEENKRIGNQSLSRKVEMLEWVQRLSIKREPLDLSLPFGLIHPIPLTLGGSCQAGEAIWFTPEQSS